MTQNKKERISLRLPEDINKTLGMLSEGMGISKNAYLLMLINKEIESIKKEKLTT